MTREKLLRISKPILFNTEMVQAILDGRKTVTRRVIKPRYKEDEGGFQVITNKATGERWIEKHDWDEGSFDNPRYVNPSYKVGDILYVRETFRYVSIGEVDYFGECLWDDEVIQFKASQDEFNKEYGDLNAEYHEWKPSIHMLKSVARIFLKVTDVRVEKLQDITSEQAKNEGVDLNSGTPFPMSTARDCHGAKNGLSMYQSKFVILWDSTIKKQDLDNYGWEANPWVWVIEFERVIPE